MVGVAAAQVVDVHGDLGVVDQALEKLAQQVDVEVADQRTRVFDVVFQARPTRQVDDDARQRLVQRHVGMAVAAHAALVAECLVERLSERDADIFDRVMRVDVQVAVGLDHQVDQAVARHLIEHVVEERDAGGEIRRAGAVQVDLDLNLRLASVAGDAGDACWHVGWQPSYGSKGRQGYSAAPRWQMSTD